MKIGLVIGKFLPYHLGHHNLIQFASGQCDQLHVLIGDSKRFPINASLREMWIREDFPDVITHIIPEDPVSTDNAVWAWRTEFALGFRPDVVFSSESYGDEYAALMGAKHIMYDQQRIGNPAQGHLILEDMWSNFKYLSAPAKAHFAKRVVVCGAESTGKTTLTRELAKVYNTVWTPEYGRMYADGKIPSLDFTDKREWVTSEFIHIAQMQRLMENQLAHDANRVIFSDTDNFCTELWHERYVGWDNTDVLYANSGSFSVPDLYVLCGLDVPFEQDGTRPEELQEREYMQLRFHKMLNDRRYLYTIVTGSVEDRINQVMRIVDKMFV